MTTRPTADIASGARQLAEDIITAHTAAQALAMAASASGQLVDATAALLGMTVHGRVADRRHQLVQHTIGRVLDHAVVAFREPTKRAEFLDRQRTRLLAGLSG